MTPDLLSALRETPGCGEVVSYRSQKGSTETHLRALHWLHRCDPCLTRLAEAVIEQVVAVMPAAPGWSDGSVVDVGGLPVYRSSVLASLLSALRSENPR